MKKLNFSSCRIAVALTGIFVPTLAVVVFELLPYSWHAIGAMVVMLGSYIAGRVYARRIVDLFSKESCLISMILQNPITCWICGLATSLLLLSVLPSSSLRRERVIKWWQEVAQVESIGV